MNNNKQMKLILERWDKFILNEEEGIVFKRIPPPPEPIDTMGQLRDYFKTNATSDTIQKTALKVKELASKYPTGTAITKGLLATAAIAMLGAAATTGVPQLVAIGAAAVAKASAAASATSAATAAVIGATGAAVTTEVAKETAKAGLDLVNSAIAERMIDTLGIQLMAIEDSDRTRWGELGILFDINDKVFNFLLKAYGGKIPKEVMEASETLKQDIKSKIESTLEDEKTISEVFGGVETIQQRVDAFIAANHQVKIEQTP